MALPLGFLLSLYPSVSAATALLMGIAIALVFGNPYLRLTRSLVKPMLAWSIIGLGAGINLLVVLKAGSSGILFTICTLALTLLVGSMFGKLFKTDSSTSALINVGTAICGGSAIAAVGSAIRAKDESISIALGVVFILNALALFIFPPIGSWLQLSQEQFGLWAALAIHDTSSVVGTTLQFGSRAVEVGTTVKLVRALWIIPVTLLFARFFVHQESERNSKSKPKFPWFILGFILVSAIFTSFPSLQGFGEQVAWVAKRALVATLFLIGSGLTLAAIKNVGYKALAHGLLLWICVAAGSLAAVLA